MKKPIFKRWWFWVLIVFVVIPVLGGFIGGGGDDSTVDQPIASEEPAIDEEPVVDPTVAETETEITEEEAEVIVTAEQLLADYESNELKADQLYKYKLVEITGIVGDIGKDILDDPYLTLTNGDEYAIISVQCYFKNADEEAKAIDLAKGDQTTVLGTVDGSSFNIVVNDCVIK